MLDSYFVLLLNGVIILVFNSITRTVSFTSKYFLENK